MPVGVDDALVGQDAACGGKVLDGGDERRVGRLRGGRTRRRNSEDNSGGCCRNENATPTHSASSHHDNTCIVGTHPSSIASDAARTSPP